jgi:glycosyltransferase involved in cell wall biosynthesis/cellulose synthase/poly-beta-1,6-N-acetylglucosamine synthase-like glycosyltransferase
MSADSPFITVVMPVRNEARFIADTLGQLLRQDYPRERFEILVADGMSDDGTREIVARIAGEDGRVRLLNNPKKRSSAGRNVGFKAGQGDYFVVVDGHCHIPDDQFLRNISDCFEKSGAHCLGRPQPLDPPGLTPFQQSVALARASRLGHGGDSLIYGEFEGFASPVSNGAAYRREIFDKIGYVDEAFDACEDVEFNYRVEQAGLKAYTSPKLTVRYFPRENLSALVGQMRRYGRGRTRLYRKHPGLLSLSALVPACFAGGVAAFVALLGLDLVFGFSAFLSFVFFALGLALLAYAALVGVSTVRICRESGWDHVWRVPFVFLLVHGGLGLGMWEEVLMPLRRYLARSRRADGPLRIAFLIDTIESPTAGTERQLLLLLEGLDRKEFEPRLCVLQSSIWLDKDFHLCPVSVLGISSFKSPCAWWRILRFTSWLWREKIDVLQLHFPDASLAGLPAAWLARVPGIVATRKNQGYWMTSRELVLQKLLNWIPDMFVANSEATRQWAHKNERIALNRIRVIHNGFAGNFTPVSDERRKAARGLLGLPQGLPVAGIVANLRPVKRIDVFLRAAVSVAKELPTARFLVVGEGNERGKLEALCAELGLTARVVFLGRRPDVMDILSAFDVGVLSSDSESFSNAVVEYMAAGLAVVATDVGGCREALGDSPAGALVPPGDAEGLGKALARMLADENVLSYARSQHPLRVQDLFSRDRYIAAYSDLYRDLLGVRGEGAA